ncbi:hypothetical protein ETB97_005756 [Aspergillus alliaceus]|uniref:Uncharacterized protein n=1 Tax=Petromyces alliaceus TaxID=209559 RepID=A0A8H5ZY89_PETAA|nr:hypothetical protein ETB97_005756 [Aspergillus burnettii]
MHVRQPCPPPGLGARSGCLPGIDHGTPGVRPPTPGRILGVLYPESDAIRTAIIHKATAIRHPLDSRFHDRHHLQPNGTTKIFHPLFYLLTLVLANRPIRSTAPTPGYWRLSWSEAKESVWSTVSL